jgi:hypothetical protein
VLPIHSVVLGADLKPKVTTDTHQNWIVASQDCTLARAKVTSNEPVVEIRPILDGGGPRKGGIRSPWFRIDAVRYVADDRPRCHVSPALLNSFVATLEPLDEAILREFKTWLGYRYDRPAVPESLLPLAEAISKEVQVRETATVAPKVRDVLMAFETEAKTTHFTLFAVVYKEGDVEEVRMWLAGIALAIPATLGVGDEFQVATPDNTPLSVLEASYAADAKQLTWPE